ncbi:hypothetical protein WA026_002917 [Henosepilachna vigintioctopunctata]|uniref:Phorbol-ester/DAG-type domain-containing protein n=1 Tax=Henosepilachna vigintioctopunctata TaxID=420089 RepID=A0AAW1TIP6_9CUCU
MANNEDADDDQSSNLYENNVKKEKVCAHCNKKVIDVVTCSKCKEIFHRSCLSQAANKKSSTCVHVIDVMEQIRAKEDETLRTENNLLKLKVKYLEEILFEVKSKNEVLMQNNSLLIEKVRGYELKKGDQNNHKKSENTNMNNSTDIKHRIGNKTQGQQVRNKEDTEIQECQKTMNTELSTHTDVNVHRKWSEILGSNLEINQNKQTVAEKETENGKNVHLEKNKDENWQLVNKNKRTYKNTRKIICTGSNKIVNPKIVGVQKRKWVYVGKISGKATTEHDITHFMNQSEDIGDVHVKKLETKGNNSAFSVGVIGEEAYNKVCSNEFWPEGIIVREFNFRNFFQQVNRKKSNT